MFLVSNIPWIKCYVDKAYLTNHQQQGRVLAYLNTVKVLRNHTLMWEVYLPDQAALYDKVPTIAIAEYQDSKHKFGLSDIEIWNNSSEYHTVIVKSLLKNAMVKVEVDGELLDAKYLFTIDFGHNDDNVLDVDFSTNWAEHKSKNVLFIQPTGQLGAFPNNKMRVLDDSLCPKDVLSNPVYLKTHPDVKYSVDSVGKLLGNSTSFDYKS